MWGEPYPYARRPTTARGGSESRGDAIPGNSNPARGGKEPLGDSGAELDYARVVGAKQDAGLDASAT